MIERQVKLTSPLLFDNIEFYNFKTHVHIMNIFGYRYKNLMMKYVKRGKI